ncbi:hypothetical protein ISP15_10580 [Dyella jejuensis]|uniref:Uncharacterized protein n=1 Tax=Dyella jejuensis TaxID=1432009 RepID=A0ABW8JIF7_9GAMM
MPGVTEFLEKMGSEAHWRNAAREDIELALDGTDIETPVRNAILDKDNDMLHALLHQAPLFGTMLPTAPDEEEEEQEEDEPGENPGPKGIRGSHTTPSLAQA